MDEWQAAENAALEAEMRTLKHKIAGTIGRVLSDICIEARYEYPRWNCKASFKKLIHLSRLYLALKRRLQFD